jgi:RHH-type transcriptional regulator, rel operon repressor / antitoxin RelB
MLAIRLPPEIEKRLDDLAKMSGRTKTHYVREAILRHLEDYEDAALAEKRLDEFYKSGEKAIPLAEIMRDLGMDT